MNTIYEPVDNQKIAVTTQLSAIMITAAHHKHYTIPEHALMTYARAD